MNPLLFIDERSHNNWDENHKPNPMYDISTQLVFMEFYYHLGQCYDKALPTQNVSQPTSLRISNTFNFFGVKAPIPKELETRAQDTHHAQILPLCSQKHLKPWCVKLSHPYMKFIPSINTQNRTATY